MRAKPNVFVCDTPITDHNDQPVGLVILTFIRNLYPIFLFVSGQLLQARKIFDVLGSANAQLPGLLPDYVQDVEGQTYSNYRATVGGMVDSYYEVHIST